MYLDHTPHEFDFELLLEHLQELEKRVPPSHPHFLTWVSRMEQV
jgi:hypothetical protein